MSIDFLRQSFAQGVKPLDGIRVIDSSHVFAIPFTTAILGELGAEVIKVQAHTRIDVMASYGPFPENDPGDRPFDRVGCLNTVNRGKKGISLDLTKPEAIEIFRKLVAVSDVLAESFTPRVMKKLGLDYDSLIKIRPDLIMLSNTGYGHTGPWSDYGSVATALEGTTGMCWLSGFEDGPPSKVGQSYTDFLATWNAAYAILASLFRRRRTGKGQWIDLSMYQCGAATLGPAIMDYVANGRVQERAGNRHPLMAPHNVYQCCGDDRWIAIAIDSNSAWDALRHVMGDPAWAADNRFMEVTGRLAAQAEIDQNLADWAADQDAFQLAERLQALGIMAGVVENGRDLFFDPQLAARGFLETVDHNPASGVGQRQYIGRPWAMSDADLSIPGPPPMLGEHNCAVLTELLGYSDSDVDQLAEAGVIGDTPAATRPLRPLALEQMRKRKRIGTFDPHYRDGVVAGESARVDIKRYASENS